MLSVSLKNNRFCALTDFKQDQSEDEVPKTTKDEKEKPFLKIGQFLRIQNLFHTVKENPYRRSNYESPLKSCGKEFYLSMTIGVVFIGGLG